MELDEETRLLLQAMIDAPRQWYGRNVLKIATKLNGKPIWLEK